MIEFQQLILVASFEQLMVVKVSLILGGFMIVKLVPKTPPKTRQINSVAPQNIVFEVFLGSSESYPETPGPYYRYTVDRRSESRIHEPIDVDRSKESIERSEKRT